MSKKSKIVIEILIIFIVVSLGWYIFGARREAPSENELSDIQPSGFIIGDNAIYIENQLPSNFVIVNLAILEHGGFIIVHESNEDIPGSIVGVSAFQTLGKHNNVAINLSKSASNGEVFFAMLHRDNGDNKFIAAEDVSVKDSNGNVIMMKFTTNDGAIPSSNVSY